MSIATPPGWDASPSQVTPPAFRQVSLTVRRYPFIFLGGEAPAQEHNTMTRPGLESGPLDPEFNALTTRPPRLP